MHRQLGYPGCLSYIYPILIIKNKGMLNYTSSNFKSLEELKEIAPSIFTTKGAESTSDKYTHIPTDRVITDMEYLVGKLLMQKRLRPVKMLVSKSI